MGELGWKGKRFVEKEKRRLLESSLLFSGLAGDTKSTRWERHYGRITMSSKTVIVSSISARDLSRYESLSSDWILQEQITAPIRHSFLKFTISIVSSVQ